MVWPNRERRSPTGDRRRRPGGGRRDYDLLKRRVVCPVRNTERERTRTQLWIMVSLRALRFVWTVRPAALP